MDSPSKLRKVAIRFAPYIEELHALLSRNGRSFGAPEDLPPFAAGVSVPSAFQDDTAALVRSVVYRENKAITTVELLELLVVAAGGPQVDEAAEDLHQPVGQLLAFIRKASRVLQSRPSDEPLALRIDRPVLEAASKDQPDHQPHIQTAPDAVESSPDGHEWQTSPVAPAVTPHGRPQPDSTDGLHPSGHILAHALSMSAAKGEEYATRETQRSASVVPDDREGVVPDDRDSVVQDDGEIEEARFEENELEPEPVEDIISFSVPAPPSEPIRAPEPILASGTVRREPTRQAAGSSRPILVPALGLLFLAVFAGLLLRHREHAQPLPVQQVRREQRPAAHGIVSVPKPSVDGAPLSDPFSTDPTATRDNADSPDDAALAASVRAVARAAQTSRQTTSASPPAQPNLQAQSSAGGGSQTTSSASGWADGSAEVARNLAAAGAPGVRSDRPQRPDRPSASGRPAVGGLFSVSSGVMSANLLSAPPPEYPKLASFAHIEGQVILQAVVARDGKVINTHVLRGHHLLRGAAERAVRNWRYRPYVVNGRAIDVETIVTVDFRRRP